MVNPIRRFISHPLVRSGSLVFAGSMVTNISAYLFHLFVGRILGPVQYGELSAILSLFFVLNVPANALQTMLMRYFSVFRANGQDGQTKRLFTVATVSIFGGSMALFIILLPLIPRAMTFLHLTHPMYFVFLFFILQFQILTVINLSLFQAYQKFSLVQVYANVGMVFRLVLGILASFYGVLYTLFSNVVAAAIGYGVYFFSMGFLKQVKSERLSVSKRSIVSYGVPAVLASFGITSMFSTDVVLVKHYFPPLEAGYYSSLSVLGRIIFFASSAILFVTLPNIVERHERKMQYARLLLTATLMVGMLSLGLTSLYAIFPAFFVRLLFGGQYDAVIPYLGTFGLFLSFVSVSNILVYIAIALGDTFIYVPSMTAAIGQIAGIILYHDSLAMVIHTNIVVSGLLFVTLALYMTRKAYAER